MRPTALLVLVSLMASFDTPVVAWGEELDSVLQQHQERLRNRENVERVLRSKMEQLQEEHRKTQEAKALLNSALKHHQSQLDKWERLSELLSQERTLARTGVSSDDRLNDAEALDRVVNELSEKIHKTREVVRLIATRLKDQDERESETRTKETIKMLEGRLDQLLKHGG